MFKFSGNFGSGIFGFSGAFGSGNFGYQVISGRKVRVIGLISGDSFGHNRFRIIIGFGLLSGSG